MRHAFSASSCLAGALMLLSSSALARDPMSPFLQLQPRARTGLRIGSGELAVTVRLRHAPTADLIRRLRGAGATPRWIEGKRLVAVGEVLSVRVPRHRLAALAALPEVVRIDPAVPPVVLRPLNKTSVLVGAPFVHPFPVEKGNLGEGVLVADHEGGCDLFHPDFFRPDGGLFGFEDASPDGKAGPGDRVDLDGDGVFESTLRLLEGRRFDSYTGESDYAEPGYQPDVDWLYVDSNGDEERNFGAAAGFSDEDAAFGEPIFVGDDINQDGQVSGGERLVRLGSSKVRVGYVNGTVYRRGENLASYPVTDAGHGTGAAGIVAMGWPELRRYTGIAPGVDLALISSDDIVEGIAFAQEEGVQVNLYEFNLPTEANDGSSNVEAAIAQAASGGSAHLAAAGNLAGVDKVMQVALVADESLRVNLSTDRLGRYKYSYAFANLTWQGAAGLVNVAIIGPQGTRLELGAGGIGSVDGFRIESHRQQTDHETGWVLLFVEPANGSVLPEAELSVELSSASPVPLVQGLLFDSDSGWAKGVSWTSHVTDAGTALCPSTGDQVIAVTAYGGNHDFSAYGWGGPGERRAYSGMGPRIDGAAVVDIGAPDDPFTASPYNASGHGSYQSFGGTSGALPHVAGATALLRAAHPSFGHAELEAALKASAMRDAYTGQEPSEQYGHGKLRVDTAIGGALTPQGSPPTLRLQAVSPVVTGQQVTLRAVVTDADDHAGDVLVAWDVGYDRQYERPAASDREITVELVDEALPVVAKAIDPTGRCARAMLVLSEEAQDAGVDASKDAGDAEASGDASDLPAAPQSSEDDDGCGCGVAGAYRRTGGWLAVALGVLAWRRRRGPARGGWGSTCVPRGDRDTR